MGQSASLQVIKSWKQWVIHQMVALPFRRTLTGWRSGLTGVSWSLAKGNATSHPWRKNPQSWGLAVQKAALPKRPLGSSGHLVEHKPAMCPCGKGGEQNLGCTKKSIANRSREVTPLLYSGHHGKSSSVSRILAKTKALGFALDIWNSPSWNHAYDWKWHHCSRK